MNDSQATPATQAIKLIVDRLEDVDTNTNKNDFNSSDTAPVVETLDVPNGRSWLFTAAGEPPRIEDGDEQPMGKTFALEPFRQDHQYLLMLASPPGQSLMLNGKPSPSLAVLEEGDQIRDPLGDHVLHVTYFLKPYVGSPPPAWVAAGQTCCLCRLPLLEGTRVYNCPFCGGVTHLETNEHKAGDKPLQCAASTSTCPDCSKPIVKNEGLTYVPREVLKAVQHG